MVKEKSTTQIANDEKTGNVYELILFNDNVNDFVFVIDSLIEVCELDPIQAEQITLITHEKGKCGVISGTFDELKLKYLILTDRGLTVSIE